MGKYNIRTVKDKDAKYRNLLGHKLAEEIGTNTRYISAVIASMFHTNYSSLVNQYRVNDAMSILSDKRNKNLRIEEVSEMVGFSTRQSFYAAFYKFTGITPRQYKMDHMKK